MTIKIIFAVYFMAFVFEIKAQHTKSVELKPIHVQGGRYFYDYKQVYGGPYAVQIPLLSLEDEQVNLRLRNYKTLRVFETIVSFVPLVYFFSFGNHQYVNYNTFWTVWGTSLVAAITLEIAAKSQLKKGIDRYNLLILQPSSNSLGASITYKFGRR